MVADGVVVEAAPIVKYMRGKTLSWVKWYANKRGWTIEESCAYVRPDHNQ